MICTMFFSIPAIVKNTFYSEFCVSSFEKETYVLAIEINEYVPTCTTKIFFGLALNHFISGF